MTSPFEELGIDAPEERPLSRRELRERRVAEAAAEQTLPATAESFSSPEETDATRKLDAGTEEPAVDATQLLAPTAALPLAEQEADAAAFADLGLPEASEKPALPADTAPLATAVAAPRRRRKMKPAVKWSLLSVAALMIVGVGYAGAYAWSLWNSFDSQVEVLENVFAPDEDRPEPLTGAAEGAQTILLLGSDTRGEIEDIDDLEGQRSDTIMVAHIPADREQVVVMSIMRDNWVEIPGRGEHKINAAMAFGGVPLVLQTVENFIGTRIDHVAVIDFEGFKGVTEALGGVTVDNPRAFRARSGEQFEAGQISLQGDAALAFVRERYAFPDGDYSRAANQQLFMKGVMSSVLSADTLTNPSRISGMVNSIAPFMQVDAGLNVGYLASLGFEMRDVRASDVTFFTSPTLGTGEARGQSIVRVDWDEMEKVRAAFRDGTLGEYEPPSQ